MSPLFNANSSYIRVGHSVLVPTFYIVVDKWKKRVDDSLYMWERRISRLELYYTSAPGGVMGVMVQKHGYLLLTC